MRLRLLILLAVAAAPIAGDSLAQQQSGAGAGQEQTLAVEVSSRLLSRVDHDRITQTGLPQSAIASLPALRADITTAMTNVVVSLCGSDRPTQSQTLLITQAIENNRRALDQIAALDPGLSNEAATSALVAQDVPMFSGDPESFVALNMPACVRGGERATILVSDRVHRLLSFQTRILRMLIPTRQQPAVRLVGSVDPASASDCGVGVPGSAPIASDDIWRRFVDESGRLPNGVAPRSVVLGIIDRGVEGPRDPGFPPAVFASRGEQFSDQYGSGKFRDGYIGTLAGDPEINHGTGVADLATGGFRFRQAVVSAQQPSPVRLRVYSLASEQPDFSPDTAFAGVSYLVNGASEYDAVRPAILNLSFEQDAAEDLWRNYTDGSWGERFRNVLYVAAAGNRRVGAARARDLDDPQDRVYPAALGGNRRRNVITVAALTPDRRLASFSNYGAETVEIAAPGCRVQVLGADHLPRDENGTSFAAPQVSFAAALIASLAPQTPTSAQIKQRLIISADFEPELEDQGYVRLGAVLNIARAMSVNSDVLTTGGVVRPGVLSEEARNQLRRLCGGRVNRRLIAAPGPNNSVSIRRYYIGDPGEIVHRTCQIQQLQRGALMFASNSGEQLDLGGLQQFDILLRAVGEP